jgi:hypothetical protein
MFAPESHEKHRLVLELPGGGKLTQDKYKDYKKAVKAVAKKFGAKVAAAEFVVVKRKPAR